MSTIVTRSGKGSPLTNTEIDANFNNLNTDKLETGSLSVTTNSAGTAGLAYTSNVFTYTPPDLSGFAALSGAAFTGAITTNSTFDGRDVATDGTKLDGIEASADVTDTANVTASGALMDSEVTNLAQVKAFDSSDYATATQGATADAALPKSGGALTGAVTTNSTFDGVDIAVRDAVLTTTTNAANAALPKAGGTMTGPLVIDETTAVKMSAGTTAQRPTGVAGHFRYNTTEGKFEGYSTEWGEIGGGAADLLLNSFAGDGSDVTFTLSGAAIENNTLAYIDGVYQNKTAYTVSGATPAVVTFSEAPATGAAIEIMVAAIAVTEIGTPADNTVTTAKLVNDAVTTVKLLDANVTTAKIADGSVTSAKLAAGAGGAFNNFLIKTTAYTAATRDQLIVNSSSAVTITLPASPSAGNVVFIKNAGAGVVTVGRNGSNINSTTDDGSLAADAGATLVYADSTIGWKEL